MSKSQSRRQDRRPAAASPAATRDPGSAGRFGEFKPDYTYVVKDLRRIALLAGLIIAGLIILSFFL